MLRVLLLLAVAFVFVVGFSQVVPSSTTASPVVKYCDGPCHHPMPHPGMIQHVIIIVQENRTPDNLFQGLPGADIAKGGTNSKGIYVALMPRPLANRYDLDHSHTGFKTEFAGGAMNGFDLVKIRCRKPCRPTAFGYVPRKQIMPYWTMATTYTFADRTFQDNQARASRRISS